MPDLKTQLSDYCTYLDERFADISPEDIVGGREPVLRPVPSVRRGVLVALAAAGLVLLLVGGVAVVSQLSGDEAPVVTDPTVETTLPTIETTVPSTTEATTSTTVAATSTTVPPVVVVSPPGRPDADVAADLWAVVELDPAVFPETALVEALIWGEPGFVMFGTLECCTDDEAASASRAIWVSLDGLTWTASTPDFGADYTINDVVATGSGLVAVGRIAGADGASEAAIWTSPDAVRWSRVPHDEENLGVYPGGAAVMESVAVGPAGLVATGVACQNAPCRPSPALWTSPNGTDWTVLNLDESVFPPPASSSEPMPGDMYPGEVVGHPGGYLAVGSVLGSAGTTTNEDGTVVQLFQSDLAIWTSPDGQTWSRVPHDDELFGGPDSQGSQAVLYSDAGFLIAGYSNDTAVRPTAWWSPDGRSWTRTTLPHDDDDWLSGATTGGPGYVAVGLTQPSGTSAHEAIVWTSPDGLTWTRLIGQPVSNTGPGSSGMDYVAAGEGKLLAIGTRGTRGAVLTAWVTPPPSAG